MSNGNSAQNPVMVIQEPTPNSNEASFTWVTFSMAETNLLTFQLEIQVTLKLNTNLESLINDHVIFSKEATGN